MKKKSLLLLFFIPALNVFGTPDSWVQKSALPASSRAGAVAFALDGSGYVGTGLDSAGNLLNDFWKYNALNDTWSQVAAFPGTPRKNAVAFVTDSFAFVGTGYDAAGLTKDFYRYDATNNSWQQIADLDSAGAVYPRRDAASFAFNNKGYVVGGYDGTTFYSKATWEYDGNRDTVWTEKTSFPLAGRRWATGFSVDNFGFFGLGYNFSQEYFHDFWMYDVATNTWTQMADFIGNKRGYAVSFVINGFAYVGSGFDGALKGDFYVFDYLNNSWGQVATFGGLPTSAAAAFSLDGKGYVFGGVDTLGYKNELWEYTPDNTLGVNNPPGDEHEAIFAYPNPAPDHLVFENLKDECKYVLTLYDTSGKLIFRQSLSHDVKTVSLKNLKSGIYYYCIEMEAEKYSRVTGKVLLQ